MSTLLVDPCLDVECGEAAVCTTVECVDGTCVTSMEEEGTTCRTSDASGSVDVDGMCDGNGVCEAASSKCLLVPVRHIMRCRSSCLLPASCVRHAHGA